MLYEAWDILCELSPWLLLGMLVAGLLHVVLPAGFVHRKLQGRAGVFKAVGLGVPLPLCSCGVVPAGIGLKRDGASDGASVGFLISTPQTGVDSVLVSASFLGLPFALFKVFSAAVAGIAGGLLADLGSGPAESPPGAGAAREGHVERNLRGMLSHATEILRSIWIWLLIGVVASAAIDTYIPASVFTQIGAWGSAAAAFVVLLISLPLYVCATASVPIAAVLVSNGLPPGTALVFLMAGPATNVVTIGAIYRTFGLRTTAIYLATIVVGSIGFAVIFDWLLPMTVSESVAHLHEHTSWWSQASALVLIALLTWFAIEDGRRWWRNWRRKQLPEAGGLQVSVQGMTCNGCVNRLEKVLRRAEGVEAVAVELDPGQATVQGSIGAGELMTLIRESGFEPQEAHVLSDGERPLQSV